MRYSVWGAVAERLDVRVRLVELPEATGGALLHRDGERNWILVDRRLSPTERRVRVLHELVHLERGDSTRHRDAPPSWDAMVAREEGIVNEVVAERLVPATELALYVAQRVGMGEPVTAADIAAEFGVDEVTARRAANQYPANSLGRFGP